MKAAEKDAEALAGLVKIVWPENTEEALVRIVLEYMNTDGSPARQFRFTKDESVIPEW